MSEDGASRGHALFSGLMTSHAHGQRFAGRVALVTGASRGIGFAVAQRLVAEGGQVCLTARKRDALTEAVERLGGTAHAIAVDGRADDGEHQSVAITTVVRQFGHLDVLVNNTGINPAYGRLTELDDAVARKIMDVNVLAALSWTRRALAAGLGSDGSGAIVNVASIAGLAPSPGIAYYGVSKSALIGLTMQLAAELSPGVRVNAVAPAVVKTRFAEALYVDDELEAARAYPLGRLGEPEDIGAAVAFLASADAAWITGQTIVVDGGLSLRAGLQHAQDDRA
jgi:NAD(P)-dependent dehydrogenase (short-subunit alcohol dehydrogenase family)